MRHHVQLVVTLMLLAVACASEQRKEGTEVDFATVVSQRLEPASTVPGLSTGENIRIALDGGTNALDLPQGFGLDAFLVPLTSARGVARLASNIAAGSEAQSPETEFRFLMVAEGSYEIGIGLTRLVSQDDDHLVYWKARIPGRGPTILAQAFDQVRVVVIHLATDPLRRACAQLQGKWCDDFELETAERLER